MSSNSFIDLINNYIEKRNFNLCNNLLKKEIVYIYTQKVRKYDNSYCYSTTVELLEAIRKYLSIEESISYINFYNILNEESMIHEKTYKLLDLYKSLISVNIEN